MDPLATLGFDPATATPESVRAGVAAAAAVARYNPERRAALADALSSQLIEHADSIATALPTRLVADWLGEGRDDLVATVIDRWSAAAAWDRVGEIRDALASPGRLPQTGGAKPLLALTRALAFVAPADARRVLSRARLQAGGDPDFDSALDEAGALIEAFDDIPSGEGAARRALARIAVERDWRPESWGPDHGALVAMVKRRLKGDSDGFGGPLMQFLTRCAPAEIKRIAKKSGVSGGGGASFWAPGSAGASSSPGAIGVPDPNRDRSAYMQVMANSESADREGLRLREGLAEWKPADSGHTGGPPRSDAERLESQRARREARALRKPASGRRIGGINAPVWWFPLFVAGLFIVWHLVRIIRRL